MSKSPRFLVIGCNSIGQRHVGNLLSLGVRDIVAFDAREDRRAEAEARLSVPTVEAIEEGWEWDPDVALIATPTSLHVPLALEAARRGCHLFIEKPLGDSLDGVDELLAIVNENNLTSLVGCNMRFHHGPATIKRLLDEEAIGRIITILIDVGQYLPDWHPWEDYRQMYSANASLGGGVLLDGIHEIDYARWLFGEVVEVYSQGGKFSSLDIDTEDSVNILMKVVSGFSVSIHLDYVQRAYCRTCKVIGEEGTIVWDIAQGDVRLYSARDEGWCSFPEPENYGINRMYVEEMLHFLRCLRGEEQSVLGVQDAKRVLEITLAIKDSMRSGEKRRVVA